jgi:hypothetical protein
VETGFTVAMAVVMMSSSMLSGHIWAFAPKGGSYKCGGISVEF